ncbi:PLDc N-terminal domain-containing protein [Streptomyces griseus]|uniref:PLDc N-terminal domain-containing protein n=1 Tax=Streptomyces griseus TaxID=1911 RepID=UPI00099DB26F|nr:PLDc N-terminal domain-containing protein [Streptomyces griseus]
MLMTLLVVVLAGIVALLWWGVLIDCARTPEEQIRFVPKLLWLLFLLHAPVIGGLAWTYLGKTNRTATRGPVHRTEPLVKSGSGGI